MISGETIAARRPRSLSRAGGVGGSHGRRRARRRNRGKPRISILSRWEVGRIDYKYDLVGTRSKQVRSGTAGNDVTEYEYDDADQLVEEELDGPNHERETEYRYDERGNQIKAGGDKFEYYLDNTLAKATLAAGQSTTFAYDATGLRLASTTAFQQQSSTQRWSWDEAGTLPQIATDTVEQGGAVVEKRGFAYGPDDEPLALLDPAARSSSPPLPLTSAITIQSFGKRQSPRRSSSRRPRELAPRRAMLMPAVRDVLAVSSNPAHRRLAITAIQAWGDDSGPA